MNSDNYQIGQVKAITNLNKMISSLSVKSDFYELESEFFKSITSIIPAHATALYLFNSSKQSPSYISGKGIDEDFLSFYEKKGREVDPLRSWIMTKRSPNQSQLLLGLRGWQQHPVYKVVKTASIDFAMQSPIVNGDEIIGTLNFGRELSEGPFNKLDLCSISILSHFLGLAIINSFGSSNLHDYNLKFYASIENMTQGMFIADNYNNIIYANNRAKNIIVRHFGSKNTDQKLTNLVFGTAKEKSEYTSISFNSLQLRSCPLPGANKKKTIVFIEEAPSPKINNSVKEILTNREIDVLILLDRGMQNKQIAEKLKISANTVKRHLENMYGKFNVNSRTKLISKFYFLNSL